MLDAREAFQLASYRVLARALSGRPFALKGGAALRFHHGSPRLSEDIDFDVGAKPAVFELRDLVDRLLASRALLASLAPAGIAAIQATRPKQTETTQRWKVGLTLASGVRLSSKIEFSRRAAPVEGVLAAPPAPAVLAAHGGEAFVGRTYDASTLAAMKVRALADPLRAAVRDLFDLHHLTASERVDAESLAARLPAVRLRAAAEKALAYGRPGFEAEVAPFLAPELASSFGGRWESIQNEMAGLLERAARSAR